MVRAWFSLLPIYVHHGNNYNISYFLTTSRAGAIAMSQCTKLNFQSSSPYGQFGFSSVTLSNQHAYSYRMGHVSTNRRTKAQKWYTLFSFGPRFCVFLQVQSSSISSSATDRSPALPQQLASSGSGLLHRPEQFLDQLRQLSTCLSLLPPQHSWTYAEPAFEQVSLFFPN